MIFTKKVHADIIEKISSTHHKAFCRDYEAEDRALGEEWDSYWESGWGSNDSSSEWDREDRLLDYAQRHFDVYVKKDDWTHKMVLFSEQSWYEHKIRIRYCFNEKTIEKIITINSSRNDIRNVYVLFKKRDPENIIDIKCD